MGKELIVNLKTKVKHKDRYYNYLKNPLTHGTSAVPGMEHLLPETLQLRDFLQQPVLGGGRLHPLAAFVLLNDSLQEVDWFVGDISRSDGRSLHVDIVGRVEPVIITGLGLGDQGDQLGHAVPVGGQKPFLEQI